MTSNVPDALSEGLVYSYQHHNAKLGVLVELRCQTDFAARTDLFRDLAKQVALQIVATSPRWAYPSDIPYDSVRVAEEDFRATGATVAEDNVQDRIKAFIKEHCLSEQELIFDESKTVRERIEEVSEELGEKIQVGEFSRIEIS